LVILKIGKEYADDWESGSCNLQIIKLQFTNYKRKKLGTTSDKRMNPLALHINGEVLTKVRLQVQYKGRKIKSTKVRINDPGFFCFHYLPNTHKNRKTSTYLGCKPINVKADSRN
jgi:hypothetical protein